MSEWNIPKPRNWAMTNHGIKSDPRLADFQAETQKAIDDLIRAKHADDEAKLEALLICNFKAQAKQLADCARAMREVSGELIGIADIIYADVDPSPVGHGELRRLADKLDAVRAGKGEL